MVTPNKPPNKPPNGPGPKMLLPHYIDDAYDRLARRHFRRAVILAPKCDLNRVIQVVAEPLPEIQLASLPGNPVESVTIGELLESLGERDFVHKAKTELGLRGTPIHNEDSDAALTVPDVH